MRNPSTRSARDHRRFLCLAGALCVTILGAAVRWHFLDYPMRYDESWSCIVYSYQTPWHIATHYAPNNHILYTLLMRVSVYFFGTSPAALRLPAFVAGVALIPLTGWLAWSLFRHRAVVLLSMLAAAGSSQLVEYSVNARGYSWMGVFAALAAICTIHLATRPQSRRLWILWGVLGALGVYAHAAMVYPMAAMALTFFVRGALTTWRNEKPRGLKPTAQEGCDVATVPVKNLALGLIVWGSGTALLYAPVLYTQGVGKIYAALGDTPFRVYGAWLDLHGGVLAMAWLAWIRHAPLLLQVVLVVGFTGFVVSALRRPKAKYVVPLALFGTLPLLVLIQNVPMVPPAWIFALPLFLACAMFGIFTLGTSLARTSGGHAQVSARARVSGLPAPRASARAPSHLRRPRSFAGRRPAFQRTFTTALVLVAAASAGMSLWNVSRQPYLSIWEHELVDMERILGECEDSGPQRCGLVTRFSPVRLYYMRQHGIEAFARPEEEGTKRVFIAAGTLRSLGELWHKDVPGYADYGPPRVWREFQRSTVYVVDRIAQHRIASRPGHREANADLPGGSRHSVGRSRGVE